ncbi:MAG: ion channel [Saprospiraceae bacterium]|nr:hypothetical protein [Lewinella sp.]
MNTLLHRLFVRQPAFWLLISVGLLILSPLLMAILPGMKRTVFALVFSLVVICGLLTTHRSFRFLLFGLILGALALIMIWLSLFQEHIYWLTFGRSLILLVLSLLIGYHLFLLVYRSRKVNMNIINASVAAFLFIGIIGGQACYLLELLQPGAFDYVGQSMWYDLQYFSFTSLTTMGITDVNPVSPQAKAVTLMISLNGQLYLTIIIAILVGKYVSRATPG